MPNTAVVYCMIWNTQMCTYCIVRFNNITELDQTQRGYIISEEINRRNNNNIYTGFR